VENVEVIHFTERMSKEKEQEEQEVTGIVRKRWCGYNTSRETMHFWIGQ